jgi:hypothetical protein
MSLRFDVQYKFQNQQIPFPAQRHPSEGLKNQVHILEKWHNPVLVILYNSRERKRR